MTTKQPQWGGGKSPLSPLNFINEKSKTNMTKDRMTTTEIGRLERNHAILEDFFKHRSEFNSVTLLYAWLGNRHGCGGETVRRLLKTYGFDGAYGLKKKQPRNRAKK